MTFIYVLFIRVQPVTGIKNAFFKTDLTTSQQKSQHITPQSIVIEPKRAGLIIACMIMQYHKDTCRTSFLYCIYTAHTDITLILTG